MSAAGIGVLVVGNVERVHSAQSNGFFGVVVCAGNLHGSSDGGKAAHTVVHGPHVLARVQAEDLLVVVLGGFARDVEQVDTGEDDEETNQQRDDVDGGCGVEAWKSTKDAASVQVVKVT